MKKTEYKFKKKMGFGLLAAMPILWAFAQALSHFWGSSPVVTGVVDAMMIGGSWMGLGAAYFLADAIREQPTRVQQAVMGTLCVTLIVGLLAAREWMPAVYESVLPLLVVAAVVATIAVVLVLGTTLWKRGGLRV